MVLYDTGLRNILEYFVRHSSSHFRCVQNRAFLRNIRLLSPFQVELMRFSTFTQVT